MLMRSRVLLCLAVFFLCVMGGCAAPQKPPVQKYGPLMVSHGIAPQIGSVEWAPDGKRLVFIAEGATVVRNADGEINRIDIADPKFVRWVSETEMLVISREGGRDVLNLASTDNGGHRRIDLEVEPHAALPIPRERTLLILSAASEVVSFGTELLYDLSVYDMEAGTLKGLYRLSKIIPAKVKDVDFTSGWISPGVNPVNATVAGMEYVDPPALSPYLKVFSIDLVMAERREIGRIPGARLTAPGSWSPDGSRMALTDASFRLIILEADGEVTLVDDTLRGIYPSWNPRGSQMYFGGYILNAEGQDRELVLEDAAESRGYWSPDGKAIAIVTARGDLWLLSGFTPDFKAPDRPGSVEIARKLKLLKELFREGLITEPQYRERYERLLNERGDK